MIKALNRDNEVYCEIKGTPPVVATELLAIFDNFIKNQSEIINAAFVIKESRLRESIKRSDPNKSKLIQLMFGGDQDDNK